MNHYQKDKLMLYMEQMVDTAIVEILTAGKELFGAMSETLIIQRNNCVTLSDMLIQINAIKKMKFCLEL